MNSIKRTTRFFAIITIAEIALVIALALAFTAGKADAHVVKPAACRKAAQQAPRGSRFAAMQRCLRFANLHNCRAHARPVPGIVTVKGQKLRRGGSAHWRNQARVISWIVSEGIRRKLPRKVVWSAIAATTQEASARELRHGHGTSLGPFQLIDIHGSAAQRITVEFSANWYFNGAMKVLQQQPRIGVAQLAQAVEASAYPTAYAQWVNESRRTLALVLGPCQLR